MEREEFEEITKKLKEGDEISVYWYPPGTDELNSQWGIFDKTKDGWIHFKGFVDRSKVKPHHCSSIESIVLIRSRESIESELLRFKEQIDRSKKKRSRKDTIIVTVIACIIVGAVILIPLSFMGYAIWGWLAPIFPSWIPAPIGILLGIIIAILICYLLLALTGGQ